MEFHWKKPPLLRILVSPRNIQERLAGTKKTPMSHAAWHRCYAMKSFSMFSGGPIQGLGSVCFLFLFLLLFLILFCLLFYYFFGFFHLGLFWICFFDLFFIFSSNRGRCGRVTVVNSKAWRVYDTVDGRNPAPPGMVLKPCKKWDKQPTSTG